MEKYKYDRYKSMVAAYVEKIMFRDDWVKAQSHAFFILDMLDIKIDYKEPEE